MSTTDFSSSWQPSASLETLKQRSLLLRRIRQFFETRSVMEVDTPHWSRFGVTDVHLENLRITDGGFLLTSPEYPMKRLLAAGSGDIFQLGHVFRRDESGPRHNLEFTMLEWYRVGWDDERLMVEVAELCRSVADEPELAVETVSYREAFERSGLPDPHRAEVALLRACVGKQLNTEAGDWSRDECLDALMALVVEPGLPGDRLVFVTRYPASQAALARHEVVDGVTVGRRFEVYWRGMELANGYWELTDPAEQARRFEADRARRRELGLAEPEVDPNLLAAMEAGLPECAGVALGVDRLLMIALGASDISEVLPFDASRA
ncbi:EF-P lysine aminoacylase EpmA [Saccharospirillum salsuginis]|uniref:EF-P lysine aminoacylase EpmA n=1 Tax=Saccharospirillum salsuginis TaxID=418750 RepID=UPI0016795E5F|nr:EF-P lysine aminoacylase EpmA [Saccharospirillum salsuginis]